MSAPRTNNEPETFGPADFIDKVKKQLELGFGFLPFIGAGLSAPSGVPIVVELHDYLKHCIARALGLDQIGETDNDQGLSFRRFRRWTPGRDDWPRFCDLQLRQRDATDWRERLAEVESQMRRLPAKERDVEYPIFQEAYGAMAEWRTALLFLARLTRVTTDIPKRSSGGMGDSGDHCCIIPTSREFTDADPRWTLAAPRPDVIDTFFLNVVLGKQPTLGHRMLARLADALRVETIMTTNFDDLMERAFAEIGRAITVFDVHVSAGLPPFGDLLGSRSLIKLHGGRYGLRADYSLDALPSDTDCLEFISYLVGRQIGHDEWQQNVRDDKDKQFHPRFQILVAGISTMDQRVIRLIESAVRSLNLQFHIFWMCYTDTDVEKARQLCSRLDREQNSDQSSFTHRFHILRHQFFGLFFQELIQHVTYTLPASAAIFPTAARVPVPPSPYDPIKYFKHESTGDDRTLSKNVAEIVHAVRKEIQVRNEPELIHSMQRQIQNCAKRQDKTTRLLLVTSDGQSLGIVSAASKVFERELNGGRQCVWIDLDDISSADDLFEQILQAVARKAGINEWMPVMLDDYSSETNSNDDDSSTRTANMLEQDRVCELQRLTNHPDRKWIVFLNARDGAGSNFLGYGDKGELWPKHMPNGWLDWNGKEKIPVKLDYYRATGAAVVGIIRSLCRRHRGKFDPRRPDTCPNLSVVVLCHDAEEKNNKRVSFPKLLQNEFKAHRDQFVPLRLVDNKWPVTFETAVMEAMKWVESGGKRDSKIQEDTEDRAMFLYALCLANRPRHPALLWTWAFHGTVGKSQERRDRTCKWLRELEEQFIIRTKLGGFVWIHCRVRDALRLKLGEFTGSRNLQTPTKYLANEIHHGLAEWYQKLLLTSDESSAGLEAIYHRCKRVLLCLARLPDPERNKHRWTRSLAKDDQARSFWLSEAKNDLCTIRQLLVMCRPTLLRSGFSKGNCRRLQSLRTDFLDPILKNINDVFKKMRSEKINGWLRENKKEQAVLKQLTKEIGLASIRLNRAIAREVGENPKAFMRHSQLLAVAEKLLEKESTFAFFESRGEHTQGKRKSKESDWKERYINDNALVLETCIERGALGIAVRSYDFAKVWFNRAYELSGFPAKELKLDEDSGNEQIEYRAIVADWASKQLGPANSNTNRLLLSRILNILLRHQQFLLAQGHSKHIWARRSKTKKKALRSAANDRFDRAVKCYQIAIEVQRFLTPDQNGEEIDLHVGGQEDPFWRGVVEDRMRLVAQCAVAHSFRDQDFPKAHRRLAEAEAILTSTRGGLDSMEMAIIELHRAEVFTHQVVLKPSERLSETDEQLTNLGGFRKVLLEQIVIKGSGTKLSFSERVETAFNSPEIKDLHQSTGKKQTQDLGIASERTLLSDGFQTLQRADTLLKKHRKNVWWSTWFLELHIKLVELRLFAALFEKPEYPLPFLGSEYAAHLTPALPDRLIDDANRMIRMDVFRLARIVESFANCLLVLSIWRQRSSKQLEASKCDPVVAYDLDKEIEALEWRQDAMRKMLEEHGEELRQLHIRRTTFDNKIEATKLDKEVDAYVISVLKHCEQVCSL